MGELTFRVGAVDYKIESVDGMQTKYKLLGQVYYSDGIIEIDSDICADRKKNVIIHELLHAMLYEAGYDEQDEEQVRRLGNVLTQVLRDNDFEFMRDEEGGIITSLAEMEAL